MELTVPVNLLLLSGASIGSVVDIRVEGGMSANVMRGTGDSVSPRLSTKQQKGRS